MPKRINELHKQRNEDIVKDYDSLYAKGYRTEVCLQMLTKDYYLSVRTLYDIIWKAKTTAKESTLA